MTFQIAKLCMVNRNGDCPTPVLDEDGHGKRSRYCWYHYHKSKWASRKRSYVYESYHGPWKGRPKVRQTDTVEAANEAAREKMQEHLLEDHERALELDL